MAAAPPVPGQCDDRQSGNHVALAAHCAGFAGRYCEKQKHTGVRRKGRYTVCAICSNDTGRQLGFIGPGAPNRARVGRARQAAPFTYPTLAETPPANWPGPAAIAAGHDAALPFPPWGGFLTPMCTPCSEMCLAEVWYRGGLDILNPRPGAANLAGVANPNSPAVNPGGMLPRPAEAIKSMPDHRNSTCTCRHTMGIIPPPAAIAGPPPAANQILCYQHRREAWNELLAKKRANEEWLYNVALSSNGRLIAASDAVKAQRVRNGTYRACRCGRETGTRTFGGSVMAPPPRPDVWLCMGCEGYVVRNTVPAVNWHPDPRPLGAGGNALQPPASGRFFTYHQVGRFRHKPHALRRPYSTVRR